MQKKWDELTHVHYNLRLREPLAWENTDDLLSFESGISESLLLDWIDGRERLVEQDDEVISDIPSFKLPSICLARFLLITAN